MSRTLLDEHHRYWPAAGEAVLEREQEPVQPAPGQRAQEPAVWQRALEAEVPAPEPEAVQLR